MASKKSEALVPLPTTTTALTSFLEASRSSLDTAANNGDSSFTVTVVTGNQAADADSVVTALLLAFIRSTAQGTSENNIFVPVVSCTRDVFENTHPLEPFFMGPFVDLHHLLYMDEELALFTALQKEGRLRVILTDHNKLAPKEHALFGDAVREIFDHHEDQRCYLSVEGIRRTIAFASDAGSGIGSACSLVAASGLMDAPSAMADTANGVASMLLDVILVDTVGLDPAAGKTRFQDVTAVAALNALVKRPSLKERYQELSMAKFNPAFWAARSISQCLMYDFKKYDVAGVRYGASSVAVNLKDLAAKESSAFTVRLTDWMRANELQFLLVLTMTLPDGAPQRELAVFSAPAQRDLFEKLAASLTLQSAGLALVKQTIIGTSIGPTCCFQGWSQGNRKFSRKRITPLIDAFLRQYHV